MYTAEKRSGTILQFVTFAELFNYFPLLLILIYLLCYMIQYCYIPI